MRAALLILRKDLRQRARDRTVWIMGLAAPLALAGVLGLLVGGLGPSALPPPSWGVASQDDGPVGASLTTRVLPDVAASLGGTLVVLQDRAEALSRVADGTLGAAFILPVGLSATVAGGATGDVEVIGTVGDELANAVAAAVARSWADEVAVRVAATRAVGVGHSSSGLPVGAPPALLQSVALHGADRTLDGPTYVAAGMAVFFLFFTVGLGVIGLLEEATNGTLPRLHVAPNPRWAVLLGKVLTSVVIGFGATATLLLATTLLLGASWGPTLPVLVLISAAVVAAASLVSVVAGLARSADGASNVQGVIAIVLGMLGGAFFPVATSPGPLAIASDLTPHGMFLTAIGDLQVPGAGIADIAPQLLGLLAFGFVIVAAGGAFGQLRQVR